MPLQYMLSAVTQQARPEPLTEAVLAISLLSIFGYEYRRGRNSSWIPAAAMPARIDPVSRVTPRVVAPAGTEIVQRSWHPQLGNEGRLPPLSLPLSGEVEIQRAA